PVQDRGRHHLSLAFSVRLPADAEERELRVTIPRLPQSRLTLDLPPEARSPQVVTAQGAQHLTPPDGKASNGPRQLTAELGRDPLLHVRWRQPAAQMPRAVVKVREAYLWDLRGPAGSLTAILSYTVTAGTLTNLRIGLPEGLEVRSVEVSDLTAASPPAAGAN